MNLRPPLLPFLLALLFGVLTVGANVGLLATSAYLIAQAALHPPLYTLFLTIVAVRFFGLSRALFRYAERLVAHDLTFRRLKAIRIALYQRLAPLIPGELDFERQGDLLSRLTSDVEVLQNFYLQGLLPPLVALITVFAVGGWLGAFDPRLSLLLASSFLIGGGILPLLLGAWGRRAGLNLRKASGDLRSAALEGLQGLGELWSYGAEAQALAAVRQESQKIARARSHLGWLEAAGRTGVLLSGNLALVGALALLIPKVQQGSLAGVWLPSLALGLLASFEALTPLPEALRTWGEHRAALRRILDLPKAPPLSASLSPSLQRPDLEAHHLSLRYPDGTLALRDLEFTLPYGSHLLLRGPSGSGKTSLFQLLLGFYPYEGSIAIGGYELRSLDPQELRKLFSVVPQRVHIFSKTLAENLLLARPQASEEELWEALELVGAADWARQLPQGLQTLLGEGGGVQPSGGEARRIALARAILKGAPIVLLDEATEGLDPLLEEEVLRNLAPLLEPRSLLLVSHRPVRFIRIDGILEWETPRGEASIR